MKKQTILPICLSVLILLFLPALANAATAQWYPSVGTKVEYNLSAKVIFDNKDVQSTNTFDLYEKTGFFYVIPSIANFYGQWGSGGYTLLAESTPITCRHEYFDNTTTQLRRVSTLIWNSTLAENYILINFSNTTFWMGSSQSQIDTLYTKNDYATTLAGFLDYLPNYLGIAEEFLTFKVVGTSGDTMIFFRDNSDSYGDLYQIYHVEGDGRVARYTHNYAPSSIYSTYTTIESTSFIYERTGGIPGYELEILIPITSLAVLYVIWSRRKASKRTM